MLASGIIVFRPTFLPSPEIDGSRGDGAIRGVWNCGGVGVRVGGWTPCFQGVVNFDLSEPRGRARIPKCLGTTIGLSGTGGDESGLPEGVALMTDSASVEGPG